MPPFLYPVAEITCPSFLAWVALVEKEVLCVNVVVGDVRERAESKLVSCDVVGVLDGDVRTVMAWTCVLRLGRWM